MTQTQTQTVAAIGSFGDALRCIPPNALHDHFETESPPQRLIDLTDLVPEAQPRQGHPL